MTYACIMGIDPGKKGAIAFYFPECPEKISAYDMPLVDNEVDSAALARLIAGYKPDICVLERVHAMPGNGISSMFSFGMAYGMVRGILGAQAIRYILVTPVTWKKHFGLSSDKEASRWLAISTWPASTHFTRKKDEGRAEAALLAKYGADTLKD